jgi:hypothetical protein
VPVYGGKYLSSLIGFSFTYTIVETARRIKAASDILLSVFFISHRFHL